MVNPAPRDEPASDCLEESQQSTLRLVLIPTLADASHGELLCSAGLSFKSKRVRQPCREPNLEHGRPVCFVHLALSTRSIKTESQAIGERASPGSEPMHLRRLELWRA